VEFTEARVKGYEPPDGALNYSMWDENLPGFGFRVQNGGNKIYYAKYRIGKLQRWLKIEKVSKISLTDAKNKAKGLLQIRGG
jgi:hypothetical protein